jgi:hypothetical protein
VIRVLIKQFDPWPATLITLVMDYYMIHHRHARVPAVQRYRMPSSSTDHYPDYPGLRTNRRRKKKDDDDEKGVALTPDPSRRRVLMVLIACVLYNIFTQREYCNDILPMKKTPFHSGTRPTQPIQVSKCHVMR